MDVKLGQVKFMEEVCSSSNSEGIAILLSSSWFIIFMSPPPKSSLCISLDAKMGNSLMVSDPWIYFFSSTCPTCTVHLFGVFYIDRFWCWRGDAFGFAVSADDGMWLFDMTLNMTGVTSLHGCLSSFYGCVYFYCCACYSITLSRSLIVTTESWLAIWAYTNYI